MGSAARIPNYVALGIPQLIGMYSKSRGAIVSLLPVVLAVTPNTGPNTGGTLFRITGYNFDNVSSVTIGGAPATGLIVGGGIITGFSPTGTAGAQDVVVTGPAGAATLSASFTYVGGGVAPVISSLNFTQGDPLGGGSSVVITGTNLSGATGVSFGGTAGTITGNTSTTVTCTLPAKAAGVTTVSVTTPGGTSGTLAFEFWAPSTEPSCTFFAEKPNYADTAGTGTWTARAGSNATQTTGEPSAVSGAPVFSGAQLLGVSTFGALFNLTPPSQGSILAVLNPSSAPAPSGLPYTDPGIASDRARGSFGISYSSSGWSPFLTDGTYKVVTPIAMSTGSMHTGIMRWKDSVLVEGQVDGGTFGTVAIGAYSSLSTSVMNIGANYLNSVDYTGTMNAMATFNVQITNAVATKCHLWAQQRHGAL